MKTLTIILGFFFITMGAKAQEAETVTVRITIENVLNDNGTVLASLHSSDTFMKGPGIIDLAEKAQQGELSFTFENVQAGTYAIMVLHDENDNMRMDFEANGMPKENYGMSGNDMTMGPPTFEGAKFEVENEDLNLNIRF